MVIPRPPVAVLAHGFDDAGALPVPLSALLLTALAATALAAQLPVRRRSVAPPLAAEASTTTRALLRAGAIVGLVVVVVPAALGPADPALNPAPRLLFTVGWAGMLLLSSVVGPWWRQASPLRLAAAGTPGAPEADRGVWPAVAALTGFGLVEQVLTPTPLVTLLVVAVYVVGGVLVALRHGTCGLAATDPLEVASTALGSLTPLRRWGLRSPRQGVRVQEAVPGLAVFLGVLAGINLVDALAPPAGVTALLAYLGVVTACAAAFWAAARPAFLGPALIPAVAGHLAAHYLAPLLVDTQIAAVLASDPLRAGWNLLGLTGAEINAEPIPVALALWLQFGLLVAGHALAMVVASDIAHERLSRRAAGPALFGLRAVLLASLGAGVFLRFGGLG